MPLPKSASIAARATEVYTEACIAVVSVTVEPKKASADEYELNLPPLLSYLRQLLTCCACAGLLDDAMISLSCGHCYCYSCQFTSPLLKIQCRQCRERTGLVIDKHLRFIVDCYRKICILLGEHLAKLDRSENREQPTKDGPLDPLRELVREVVVGVKVSRAILMIVPPEKYVNARNSSHITREDATSFPSITGSCTSPTLVGNKSAQKKSGLSKHRKLPVVISLDEDPEHIHGASAAVDLLEDNPLSYAKLQSATGRMKIRHTTKAQNHYGVGNSKTLEPSLDASECSSDEKNSSVSSPRRKPKTLKCRCGTNNPVSLDKICVRSKCPCFSSHMGCKDCYCKHCNNPYNA